MLSKKENSLIINKWNITKLTNAIYLESHSILVFVHSLCFSHWSTFLQFGVYIQKLYLYINLQSSYMKKANKLITLRKIFFSFLEYSLFHLCLLCCVPVNHYVDCNHQNVSTHSQALLHILIVVSLANR